MLILFLGLVLIGLLYIYWRFFFFFRDPERLIPGDPSTIVSPADGTVIYIKELTTQEVLFSTKKGRKTSLKEYCLANDFELPCYLIGIFMHPTSVHVNRAPIAGQIKKIDYLKGTNLPMTLTWWRANLKMRPFEKYGDHLFSNERNIFELQGTLRILIIQIADIYVNKIESWVKVGDYVEKGQRLGIIKMGSQVDLLVPKVPGLSLDVQLGQKVKAGETILAYCRGDENYENPTG